MAFKIILQYPNGEEEEQDEVFEDEDAAVDYAGYLIGCCHEGAEILHMSNPGDYPEDDEDADITFEIIEI